MMSEAPLRVVQLGCGIFSREGQGPAWKEMIRQGRVTMVVCWSRSEESAREMCAYYDEVQGSIKVEAIWGEETWMGLLQREDIDAVTILLPIHLLARYSKAALEAGKHVLSEKPIAGNMEEARSMVEFYQARRKEHPSQLYCIAENYRFEYAFRRSMQLLGEGTLLGRPFMVELTAHVPHLLGSKYEKTQWRREAKHLGGIITDSSVHFMAGLRLLMNSEVECLSSFTSKHAAHLPKVDTLVASLRFCNGTSGSAAITFAATSRLFEYRVRCERGILMMIRGQRDGKFGYIIRYEVNNQMSEEFQPFSGIDNEIDEFVRLCSSFTIDAHGRQPDFSPEEAFRDLALVAAMLESGSREGELARPESPPSIPVPS